MYLASGIDLAFEIGMELINVPVASRTPAPVRGKPVPRGGHCWDETVCGHCGRKFACPRNLQYHLRVRAKNGGECPARKDPNDEQRITYFQDLVINGGDWTPEEDVAEWS